MRLCSLNSDEHFYTVSFDEYCSLVDAGRTSENTGWISPATGAPVYRLYNNNGKEHMYTADYSEKTTLENAGWTYEGIAFYCLNYG